MQGKRGKVARKDVGDGRGGEGGLKQEGSWGVGGREADNGG
eukprot:CAMPEP_0196659730 /NCGR_PEP_ID=MMETSP1086-20130531/36440_1 /TAXON_ID=77921 /ORGANISM="Cyanoptyche  gloeocystis , Strain SAG4.97" /LENGTH=40 /DNA_ID= /DNA_START= /DNA_END= /DNA_ORIENTATION=